MRVITAAQQGVLNAGVQGEHLRALVKDTTGVWRDLTSYGGFNAIQSASLKESVNDPHPTLDLVLMRELDRLSFSPLRGDSPLNKRYDPTVTADPLLRIGKRELKVEVAITPMDKQPAASDWMEIFRGRIDHTGMRGYDLGIAARGLSGRLAQQFIKLEHVYSYATAAGLAVPCRIWVPEMVVAAGEYLVPASRGDNDPGLNKIFKCAVGGTTGTTEPTWTTGSGIVDGATVRWDYLSTPNTSGQPVEQIIQNILDTNKGIGDSAVPLFTPISPGWNIREFLQAREHTLDAVLKLAQQIGWDLRYKWRESTSQQEFTLYQPDRGTLTTTPGGNVVQVTPPTVLFTFGKTDYGTIERLEVDVKDIRNNWRLIYPDRTDLWPDGTPKRKVLEARDDASIDKYGDLFAEIQEDENSQVDSPTEAAKLIQSAVSDCAEPTAEMTVPLMRGFPWVEVNDYYRFSANGLQYDADQKFAVTSYDHSWEGGRLHTRLELRGVPTIGAQVHIEKTTHPKNPPKTKPHRLSHFQGQKTPALSFIDTPGGARAVITLTKDKGALIEEYEHHLYPTPGTSLSANTLLTVSKDRNIEFHHAVGGQTQYHRNVPRTWNGEQLVRGQPSAELAVVAGYVEPHLMHPEMFRGELPPNGSFEGIRLNTFYGGPPDHYDMVTGTWGSDLNMGPAKGGPDAIHGARYLRFLGTSVATSVRSKYFPVACRHVYELSGWIYRDTGDNDVKLEVEWYTGAKSSISTSSYTIDLGNLTASAWNYVRTIVTAPATAAFGRFVAKKGSASADVFHLDGCRLEWCGEAWRYVGDSGEPSFANSWVNYDAANELKAAFRRIAGGEVEVQGIIKSGTVGTTAFTLPAEARPADTKRFAVMSNGGLGWVDVAQDGQVQVLGGSTTWVDFAGVRFAIF